MPIEHKYILFAVESKIETKDIPLLRKVLLALSISCNINEDDIFSSMSTFEFGEKVQILGGWDELYFLVCFEDILNISFSDEMQDSFPPLFYSGFFPPKKTMTYTTIGEWIHDIIYEWLKPKLFDTK
ncbi:MAG: hypothetical protein LBE12_08845 [Planctomycetaceae bacterium]|jgi:hypothetical protein|nr:hypothetical protein [Planctomycetaceae bacterium]